MNRIAEFERVTFEQFKKDMFDTFPEDAANVTEEDMMRVYEGVKLPARATSGSAGYDFFSPLWFSLPAGSSIKIPTGIRAKIDKGWWLSILPRSGLGTKYRVQLDNTVSVIDSDYYGSSNEGHIFVKITNDGREGEILDISSGDAFCQGIFLEYGITHSDNVTAKRDGGFGSTDAKDDAFHQITMDEYMSEE